MKRFILFSICLLTLFLCGCGKNPIVSDCLTFMTWGSESEINIIKAVIQDYETKHPDKKIKLIHTPQNYYQKLHLYFASNIEPDVIFINNIYSKIYIASNRLENLTPYFHKELADNVFYESSTNSFTYNGNLYAVPRDISDMVLYINKDIFRRNNVEIITEFKSLDELYSILPKLKGNNNFAINTEPQSIYWLNFLLLNGGGILSDDSQNIIITTNESINALQKYADLASKEHLAPTKSEIASKTTAQMFINGELAIYLSGRWMVPKFRSAIKDFDWDTIAFPVSTIDKIAIDSSGWAVSKNSKHKQDAIDFIKYMSSKEVIEKITSQGLIVPARIDVAESKIFNDGNKPQNSKAFTDILKYSKPTPISTNYMFINDILNESLEDVFNGKIKAKDALNNKLKKKLEALL